MCFAQYDTDLAFLRENERERDMDLPAFSVTAEQAAEQAASRYGHTSFLGDSRAGCRAGCEHSCPFSRLRGDALDASADKQALDSEAASCTTPHVRCSPVSSSNPPR